MCAIRMEIGRNGDRLIKKDNTLRGIWYLEREVVAEKT